jgi:hypothetical protein
MESKLKAQKPVADSSTEKKKGKVAYQKPAFERIGRLVDHTGGLSLPALESGDPQNRHF